MSYFIYCERCNRMSHPKYGLPTENFRIACNVCRNIMQGIRYRPYVFGDMQGILNFNGKLASLITTDSNGSYIDLVNLTAEQLLLLKELFEL